MPKLTLNILSINGVKTKGKVFIHDNILTFELDSNPSEIETIDLPKAFCLECMDNLFVYEYPAIIHINDWSEDCWYETCRPRGWSHSFTARTATSNEIAELNS